MDKLKAFLVSSRAKTFYWTTANGFVTLAIYYFSDLDLVYTPMILAGLNALTKYINQTYL